MNGYLFGANSRAFIRPQGFPPADVRRPVVVTKAIPRPAAVSRQVPKSLDLTTLQQDIDRFLAEELPDEDHHRLVDTFVLKLEDRIRILYSNAKLQIHGSAACGLATMTSDVDLVLSGPQDRGALTRIFRLFAAEYPQGCIEGVFSAKIPIVRVLDPESGLDTDISISETGPFVDHDYRTRLLRCYTSLDPRVAPLIILVKKWSKVRDVGEARFGFLGSFGYSLSVICYLQCTNPPVLPSVHTDRRVPEGPLLEDELLTLREFQPNESWRSTNTQSVACLMLGFFEWFAALPTGVGGNMSVRCGRVVPSSFIDMEPQRQKRCLCIEDPYQPDLNVGKGVSLEKAMTIKREFQKAASYIKEHDDVRLGEVLSAAEMDPRQFSDQGRINARQWSQRKQAYREARLRRQTSPLPQPSFDTEEQDVTFLPYGPEMRTSLGSARSHPYARPKARIPPISSRAGQPADARLHSAQTFQHIEFASTTAQPLWQSTWAEDTWRPPPVPPFITSGVNPPDYRNKRRAIFR